MMKPTITPQQLHRLNDALRERTYEAQHGPDMVRVRRSDLAALLDGFGHFARQQTAEWFGTTNLEHKGTIK